MDEFAQRLTRRCVLQIGVHSLMGAVISACANRLESETPLPTPSPPPGATATPIASPTATALPGADSAIGAPPPTPSANGEVGITPNDDFYAVALHSNPPKVPEDWTLDVGASVAHPQRFTLADLKSLPSVVEMRTLECISNPVGGSLISNALWKGCKASELLKVVGVNADAVEARFDGLDDFYTTVPVDLAFDPHTLLVYEMNGAPLPPRHGAPLRCLVPGRYGMKQAKWIKSISLETEPSPGYWDRRGWSKEAKIKVNSRIDAPRELEIIKGDHLSVSGVAFSGLRGLAKVELSLDEGKTWQAARLTQAPAPFTPFVWTNWMWRGAAPDTSKLVIVARATDTQGNTQERIATSLLSNAFPDGMNDMHAITVKVQN